MKPELLRFKDFLAKFDEQGHPIPQPGALVPWIDISNLLFNESKVGQLHKLIGGTHAMGGDSLADYHAAKAAVGAMRKDGLLRKVSGVKLALKNHAVSVSLSGTRVRVHRPDTKEEMHLNETRKTKRKLDPTPVAAITGVNSLQITKGGGVNNTEEKNYGFPERILVK